MEFSSALVRLSRNWKAIPAHTQSSLLFFARSRRVVTASGDGTALIFRIVTLDEVPHLLASKKSSDHGHSQ